MYIPLFFLDFISCSAIFCTNLRQIKFIYYHKAFLEIRQYLTGADKKKNEKNQSLKQGNAGRKKQGKEKCIKKQTEYPQKEKIWFWARYRDKVKKCKKENLKEAYWREGNLVLICSWKRNKTYIRKRGVLYERKDRRKEWEKKLKGEISWLYDGSVQDFSFRTYRSSWWVLLPY